MVLHEFIKRTLIGSLALLSIVSVHASTPAPAERIIPRPQQIADQEWQVIPLNAGKYTVKLPDNASEGVLVGLEILEKHLAKNATGNGQEKLLIEAAWLPEGELPEQGYRLTPQGNGKILLEGADVRGLFYGLMTLKQLLRPGELPITTISDYPVWTKRYAADYIPVKYSDYLQLLEEKFTGYSWQWRFNDWRNFKLDVQTDNTSIGSVQNALEAMQKATNTGLFDGMINLHIYAESEKFLNCADENDIKELAEVIKLMASYGVKHVMIGGDDWVKRDTAGNYICHYPDEKEKFGNSIGRAHGYLMKRLWELVHPEYPELELSFVPSIYSLRGHRADSLAASRNYVTEWAEFAPEEVMYVWTGPYIVSEELTLSDTEEMLEMLPNHDLLYWDNGTDTNNPAPAWEFIPEPGVENRHRKTCFLNAHTFGIGESRVFVITGNDALWNPVAYNPERSHAAAMRYCYGDATPTEAYKNFRRLNKEFKSGIVEAHTERKGEILKEMADNVAILEKADISPWERTQRWVLANQKDYDQQPFSFPVAKITSPVELESNFAAGSFPIIFGEGPSWREDQAFWDRVAAEELQDIRSDSRGYIAMDDQNLYLMNRTKRDERYTPTFKDPMRSGDPTQTTDYILWDLADGDARLQIFVNPIEDIKTKPQEVAELVSIEVSMTDNEWILLITIPFDKLEELGLRRPTTGLEYYGVNQRWLNNWDMAVPTPAPYWGRFIFE